MLQASTFRFLKDLKKNNNREWFADHKQDYEEAKKDVIGLTAAVLKKLVEKDPSLKDVLPEKSVMRIYRDVRFSKNKDPYKLNFGIYFSGKAKGIEGPGYYIHIQPGASFIGGGYWMPNPEHLKLIRQEIDYNANDFHAIIGSKEFKKLFGQLSEEDKLKTTPKDYPKDHPDIELLKLKSFTSFYSLSDTELCSKDAVKKIVQGLVTLRPLVEFLNQSIHI